MNIRVKTEDLAAANGQQTLQCVLAALGLQAAMPATPSHATGGEHWVASWRFCQN